MNILFWEKHCNPRVLAQCAYDKVRNILQSIKSNMKPSLKIVGLFVHTVELYS